MVTVAGERLNLVLNPYLAVYVTDKMFTSVSVICNHLTLINNSTVCDFNNITS